MTEQRQKLLDRFDKWLGSKPRKKIISAQCANIAEEYAEEQLRLHGVGWQSEQLPDFDVQEINDILKECKENKDDLLTLVSRIWNKGYMTGVCYDAEND